MAKDARQRLARLVHGASEQKVVFVAGVQRSGTNLVMDMLEQSAATAAFHERDPSAFDDYELKSDEALRRLIKSSPATTVVFKALCECQDITRLLGAFRPAQCLWVFRHYEDVVSSHVRKWQGMPDSIARIATSSTDTADWRGRGMSEHTRAFVQRCYQRDLNNASACALFWYFRNTLFFEQKLERDDSVRLLQYETLARRPQACARQIFAFLGLDLDERTYAAVEPRELGDRREPIVIDPVVREACEELQQRLVETFEAQVFAGTP